MKLRLIDYENRGKEFEIGSIEDIARIIIEVVSGDEIAHVLYKDYTEKCFDSGEKRMYDFQDGQYEVYDFRKPNEKNLLLDRKWLNRVTSYDF